MKNNIDFWKRDYIKRFRLDRQGIEILNFLISANPKLAEQFIKDKYAREVYRFDIINTYCNKYDNKKINELLTELDYAPLFAEEIKKYEIMIRNEKPKCALIGEDGNIFNLMEIASRTLKKNGMQEEAKEMRDRITNGAKSYTEALMIIDEYVEITGKEEMEEEEY